jgi:hypothetical protein
MMKKILLIALIVGLMVGCATGPPVRNPQFTESSLPEQCHIEGVGVVKNDNGWDGCVQMILNFYGKSFTKSVKAEEVIAKGILDATQIALFIMNPLTGFSSFGPYGKTIDLEGFKTYELYDQSPNGTKIKYFLTQGYPVIVSRTTESTQGLIGRFILLTGYDDSREIFFVCDPTLGEAIEMTYKEFSESVPMVKAWADESKTMRVCTIIYPKN